ncbi:hypothetical protein CMV_001114 [Castanea mollissima]|uniref:Uncharacterized protein n=1 Tax=Castanea mollissima TaxID=60419 RepID=A0A8J4S0C1_9ROSI|nr:hypothetical protein CMV_001114 [Castanea mollissima]
MSQIIGKIPYRNSELIHSEKILKNFSVIQVNFSMDMERFKAGSCSNLLALQFSNNLVELNLASFQADSQFDLNARKGL